MTQFSPAHIALAIAGTIACAAYIIFYEPPDEENIRFKKRKKGTIPGLKNLGNTCFLNCILQALASCTAYNNWLVQVEPEKTRACLLSALQETLTNLCDQSTEGEANSRNVIEALRTYGWVISSEEQDAHELFHALCATIDEELSVMHRHSSSLLNLSWVSDQHNCSESESLNEPSSAQTTEEALNSVEDDADKREEADDISPPLPKKYKPSMISRLGVSHMSMSPVAVKHQSPFKGKLASQLQCSRCLHKNVDQWSTFESISVNLPNCPPFEGGWPLTDLLQTYVCPEPVTDVICENCSNVCDQTIPRSFVKQMTMGQLPECLCIHIQRNTWLPFGGCSKRTEHVELTEILDMNPFTYSHHIANQTLQKLTSLANGCNIPINSEPVVSSENTSASSQNLLIPCGILYKLQAVVVHVGGSSSGHFITYRRGPEGNRWYYTSDHFVREVSLRQVLKSNAYMIMYDKINTSHTV